MEGSRENHHAESKLVKLNEFPPAEPPLPRDVALSLDKHRHRFSKAYVDHYQDDVKSTELFETLQPCHQLKEATVKLPFPSLLYKLLTEVAQNNEENIISWSPHGRCFVVHNRHAFVRRIMPR